jgi:hypothetical protein
VWKWEPGTASWDESGEGSLCVVKLELPARVSLLPDSGKLSREIEAFSAIAEQDEV